MHASQTQTAPARGGRHSAQGAGLLAVRRCVRCSAGSRRRPRGRARPVRANRCAASASPRPALCSTVSPVSLSLFCDDDGAGARLDHQPALDDVAHVLLALAVASRLISAALRRCAGRAVAAASRSWARTSTLTASPACADCTVCSGGSSTATLPWVATMSAGRRRGTPIDGAHLGRAAEIHGFTPSGAGSGRGRSLLPYRPGRTALSEHDHAGRKS